MSRDNYLSFSENKIKSLTFVSTKTNTFSNLLPTTVHIDLQFTIIIQLEITGM